MEKEEKIEKKKEGEKTRKNPRDLYGKNKKPTYAEKTYLHTISFENLT